MHFSNNDANVLRMDDTPCVRMSRDLIRIENCAERYHEKAALYRKRLEMILRNEASRRNRPR